MSIFRTEAQHRYVDYYYKIANASKTLPRDQVDIELPNVQSAFYIILNDKDSTLVYRFWEEISGFLWYHGYWYLYSEWGTSTLRLLQGIGEDYLAQGWLMSEQGWLNLEQGDFIAAEKLFLDAKHLFYEKENQRGICIIERYLGVLAYRRNDLEIALQQYKIAEEIAKVNNYELSLSEIYNLQARLEGARGNKGRAFELYTESKKLVEKLGDTWRLTATLRNMAQLEAEQSHFEAAKSGFEQTIALCLKVDRKDMLYSCQFKLAEVELKLANTVRAKELALAARDGFVYLDVRQSIEKVDTFLASIIMPV